MFRGLTGIIFAMAASHSFAQHTLTSPDLSSFTQQRYVSYNLQVDENWLYFSAFRTRAMGLTRRGVVRVTPDGAIDGTWQTTGMAEVYSHVLAQNGDLYVIGRESLGGPQVISRYSSERGGAPIMVYRADGVANNAATGIGSLHGGRGRWIYFINTLSSHAALNRIDTATGLIDATWSYRSPNIGGMVVKDAGDSVFILEQQFVLGQNQPAFIVKRVSADTSAALLWSRAFPPGEISIAPDDRSNLYVMTRDRFPTTRGTILRLDLYGRDDPLWDSKAASLAVSERDTTQRIHWAAGGLLLSIDKFEPQPLPRRVSLIRFDLNGAEIARWERTSTAQFKSVSVERGGHAYVAFEDRVLSLDVATLKLIRSIAVSFGMMGTIDSITTLPDGGRLFLGNFSVWYDGMRFKNILRMRADGTPDMDWRFDFVRYSSAATITSLGVLFDGDLTRADDAGRPAMTLVSLSPGAKVVTLNLPSSRSYGPKAVDNQNTLFFTEVSVDKLFIRRLSLVTGELDPNWRIEVDNAGNVYLNQLECDQAGGLWLFREQDDSYDWFPSTTKQSLVQRYNITDRQKTFQETIRVSTASPRAFLSTRDHVYLDRKRYSIANGGQHDTTWLPDQNPPYSVGLQALTRDHYYYGTKGGEITRIALNGRGEIDATLNGIPAKFKTCEGIPTVEMFVRLGTTVMNDVEFLSSCTDDYPQNLFAAEPGAAALVTTRNEPPADITVAEYFHRAANRYFMTGRPAEQAQLNALPGIFLPTGMRFAAKQGQYSDAAESPVCRLYAAPASGGSNTHFYGVGDDCSALNTVRQLRFEGFDFAAIRPTQGAGPTGAPHPVYRLFNNQTATNNGNHRYAVSAATVSKMRGNGWTDEGAVFCSTSVTDATP